MKADKTYRYIILTDVSEHSCHQDTMHAVHSERLDSNSAQCMSCVLKNSVKKTSSAASGRLRLSAEAEFQHYAAVPPHESGRFISRTDRQWQV